MERMKQFWIATSFVLLGLVLGLLSSILLSPPPATETLPVRTKVAPNGNSSLVVSYADVIERAAPSVVYIYTKTIVTSSPGGPLANDPVMRRLLRPRQQEENALGSGVIMSREGYILTNFHVIENANSIQVILPTTGEEFIANVVGIDPPSDIAVLKINAKDLPTIQVADSNQLRVGDVVLAIGNPLGVGQSVTMGIVGAISRGVGLTAYEDFIQTDASINQGNSGGALVDAEGRLVGINTAIVSQSGGNDGIGFSVPINMAAQIMKRIIEDGRMIRGFLGVATESINPNTAQEKSLNVQYGAWVSDVYPDTPAAEAGIRQEDVIIQFNGSPVYGRRQLQLLTSQARPGTKVVLKIARGGETVNMDVILAELPEESLPMIESTRPALTNPFEGVTITALDSTVRRRFRIGPRLNGIFVVEVVEGTIAWRSGLRPGNIILEINRVQVSTPMEAQTLVSQITEPQILLRVWRSGEGVGYLILEDR